MANAISTELPPIPRELDAGKTFDAMVDWVYDEIIVKRGAPGLVIGLSGTDSMLAYMACAKAFARAGRPDRVVGVHFGEAMPKDPAELQARLDVEPNAFWFQRTAIAWLREQVPDSPIIINSTIDHRKDGLRWGALMDWSVVETDWENPADEKSGRLRPANESFWVVGTRNASEDRLMNFSNLSDAVSMQPIIHLWKSEILKICDEMGMPAKVLEKSREVDCSCGRFELAALNIENIDALLMVREGLLSPEYVENTIPPQLRAQLNAFIDEQVGKARFKKEIPYKPDENCVAFMHSVDAAALAAAKTAARGEAESTQPISSVVPLLVAHGHANAACDLACTASPNRDAWLPEAMTLLGTPGLRTNQKRSMLQKIFGTEDFPQPFTNLLATTGARLGDYGFSFPKWRYLAMRNGGNPSMLETFGMQRLPRENDVADASLPPSDPNRDQFGPGFVWSDDQWTVEYRRAYIVCSNRSAEGPATVVIRNNSYFYGRDRLPAPVYVSWDAMTPDALAALDADTLEHSGRFTKWQDQMQSSDLPAKEILGRLKRLDGALNYLDQFDRSLMQWLKTDGPSAPALAGPDHSASSDAGGLAQLQAFLQNKAAQPAINGRPGLFLGEIDSARPPWFPTNAQPVNKALVARLPEALSQMQGLTLLTGEQGDFPAPPAHATQLQESRGRAELRAR